MDERTALASLDEVRIALYRQRYEPEPDPAVIEDLRQDEARLVAVFV